MTGLGYLLSGHLKGLTRSLTIKKEKKHESQKPIHGLLLDILGYLGDLRHCFSTLFPTE